MEQERCEQVSAQIEKELENVRLEELSAYLEQRKGAMITSPHPFADYMRQVQMLCPRLANQQSIC